MPRVAFGRTWKGGSVEIGDPVREIEIVPGEEPIPDPIEVPQGEPEEVPA